MGPANHKTPLKTNMPRPPDVQTVCCEAIQVFYCQKQVSRKFYIYFNITLVTFIYKPWPERTLRPGGSLYLQIISLL